MAHFSGKLEANEVPPAETGWRPFLRRNQRYLSALGTLVVIAFFGAAIFHLTAEVRYDDVVSALTDTSWRSVAAAILFTGLSFLALTFYDVGALDYIRRKLPYADVALTAACAYAVGNTAGFGPLSGGAVRYRSYSRLGLEPEEIARVIAFVTLAFGLGLAAVTCLSLLAVGEYVAPLTGVDAFCCGRSPSSCLPAFCRSSLPDAVVTRSASAASPCACRIPGPRRASS